MDGNRVEARLKALFQIAQSLTTSMKVNDLLSLILQKSQEVMNAEAASLLLRVAGTDLLEFVDVTGNVSGYLKEKRISFGEGISGEVARSKKMMNIPNAYEEPLFNNAFDEATGFRTREILAVPLLNDDHVVGVLSVINHKSGVPFGDEDESILSLFSDQASVALVRAVERKKSDQKSMSLKVLTQETARILGNELTLIYANTHRLRKQIDKLQNLEVAQSQQLKGSVEAIEKGSDALSRISKTLQAHSNSGDFQLESFSFQNAAKLFLKETHFHDVRVLCSPHNSGKAYLLPLESLLLSLESLIESVASRFPLGSLPPNSMCIVFREREGFVDFCVAVQEAFFAEIPESESSSHSLLSLATVSALVDSLGGELLGPETLLVSKTAYFNSKDLCDAIGLKPSSQGETRFRTLFQVILPVEGASL